MASIITLSALSLILLYALKIGRHFVRNLAAAKASGITYTIVPFFVVNRLYQFSCIILIPFMRSLPVKWIDPWFDLTLDWGWARRYEPFKTFGSDTFITVSPERNVLYTADPDVINQITTRRNDFPKALEVYESLKIYGNNVVTSEGQLWRHHRKIVSPPFTEKNNHLVWNETLDQTRAMVSSWLDGGPTIYTVADDAMRLSLHVISRAGFGVHLQWPGQEKAHENGHAEGENGTSSAAIPEGHEMSYTDALGSILHNILTLLITPRFLLSEQDPLSPLRTFTDCSENLPFKATKETYTSFIEWGKYMEEMFQSKKAAVLAGEEGDQMDLMVALLKGAGITKENAEKGDKGSLQSLTDEEILGNAFVFILAGHETTANSIHFTLVLLALNLASQRRLQADLDEIFQDRPVSQWNYDQDVPKLFGSMAGAVMNEELRLLAPVIGVPKSTAPNNPQPLNVDGKKCTVPENTYISLMTPAVHRNPHHWPTGPPKDPQNPLHPISNTDNDLEEFKPERWLLDSNAKTSTSMSDQGGDTEASNLSVNTAADTSAALYRPPRGAYIPFSEGYRSCIGRRFAQVEILAVIALIFSQYSVELSVDKFATDAEVEKMGKKARRKVWGKASDEVERQLREDMGAVITLQLRKGSIGLRFVKRGAERFDFT